MSFHFERAVAADYTVPAGPLNQLDVQTMLLGQLNMRLEGLCRVCMSDEGKGFAFRCGGPFPPLVQSHLEKVVPFRSGLKAGAAEEQNLSARPGEGPLDFPALRRPDGPTDTDSPRQPEYHDVAAESGGANDQGPRRVGAANATFNASRKSVLGIIVAPSDSRWGFMIWQSIHGMPQAFN